MLCHIKINLSKDDQMWQEPTSPDFYSAELRQTARKSTNQRLQVPKQQSKKPMNVSWSQISSVLPVTPVPTALVRNELSPPPQSAIRGSYEQFEVGNETRRTGKSVKSEPTDDTDTTEDTAEPMKAEKGDGQKSTDSLVCLGCGEMFDEEAGLDEHRNECAQVNAVKALGVQFNYKVLKFDSIEEMKHYEKTRQYPPKPANKPPRKPTNSNPQRPNYNLQRKKKITIVSKLKCNKCCSRYFTTQQLNMHICNTTSYENKKEKGENAEDQHKCQKCGRGFSTTTKLHEHSLYGEKSIMSTVFKCDVCGKQKKGWSTMNIHIKQAHTKKRPFVCEICGLSVKSEDTLNQHMTDQHNYPARYQCGVCGKGYHTKLRLEIHERLHTGEKPFQCDFCGKAFAYNSNLFRHKMLHKNTERTYECHLCDKKYKIPYYLKEHFDTVHDRSKDAQCQICYKVLKSKDLLKKHNEIHENLRRHKWDVCGSAYNSAASLHSHKKKHQRDPSQT